MSIRLNRKDLAILNDTARFKGLCAESIRQVHFGGSTYAWKRLNALYKNGYLGRKYYYVLNKTAGVKHSQRTAALYFPTPRGLKAIDYMIDPRYVVPDDGKLDIHYLTSRLYEKMPGLLSKRQAGERFGLKSFMPVTCVYPADPPVYITVLGEKSTPRERSRLISFFQSGIFPGTYIAVAKKFPGEKLLLTDSYFVPWDLTAEVIPKMVSDRKFYLYAFARKMKSSVIQCSGPFMKVTVPGKGIYNLGELLTGSTRLMISLKILRKKHTF